jgi:DNA-binding NtrC family response regulator
MAGLFEMHSGFSEAQLAGFEPLFARENIGWVGATQGGKPLSQPARQLLGAYFLDYFTWPREPADVASTLGHALGIVMLRPPDLAAQLSSDGSAGMIGQCEAMKRLFVSLQKIARSDAPVLITGESGTGKELAAQAIHRASSRAAKPFQAVNCAAIPPTLMLSELFGYEKGAFTGAMQRKMGRVEMADGGTFFLDEIGDMPIESQSSLLRFLETGRIERLGGQVSIPVNVRIISATHVDLDEAIRDGRFRNDLFHRLCVLRVEQPPLRSRGKDIPYLSQHILKELQKQPAEVGSDDSLPNPRKSAPRRVRGFSPAAIDAICSYDWPGNVRELINRIQRALVMVDGAVIQPEDLDLLPPAAYQPLTLSEIRTTAEHGAIVAALQRHRQRLNDTAKELGISRVTLYRLMRSHGINVDDAVQKVS